MDDQGGSMSNHDVEFATAGAALLATALHGMEEHAVESVRRDTLNRVDRAFGRWHRRFDDLGAILVLLAGALLIVYVLRSQRHAAREARRLAAHDDARTPDESARPGAHRLEG
jgi:hypothetical protein